MGGSQKSTEFLTSLKPLCKFVDVQGLIKIVLLSEKVLASQINLYERDLARSSLTALHISLTWYAQDYLLESTEPPEPAVTTHAIGYIDDGLNQRPFIMTLSILCPIESRQQRTRTRCLDVYAAHLAVQLNLEGVYGAQDSQNLPYRLQCGLTRFGEVPGNHTTFVYPHYCYCNARYTLDARNQFGKTDPALQSAYPCHVKIDSGRTVCSRCVYGRF